MCSTYVLARVWEQIHSDKDAMGSHLRAVLHLCASIHCFTETFVRPCGVQRVYVTMFPCNECAKLLIQAGIKEVIFYEVRMVLVQILSGKQIMSI